MSAKDGSPRPRYLTEEEHAELRRLHDAYVTQGQPIDPRIGAWTVALRALHLGVRLAAEVRDLNDDNRVGEAVLARLAGAEATLDEAIVAALREQVHALTAERDAVLERAARAVEALPAGTWGDETGERSPWPLAAAVVRGVKTAAPPTTKRTPMTVLRAMVAAYITDLNAKFAGYQPATDDATTFLAYEQANAALIELQDAYAAVLGAYRRPVLRDDLERDYKARESGKRPLDAPPLEAEAA